MVDMVDIEEALKELSRERTIFHSEQDFQHSLAWKLKEKDSELNIRLERRIELNGEEIYMDIYLWDKTVYLIELKYKAKAIEYELNGERFRLKDQSAHDVSRYDFLKDVSRLEECVNYYSNAIGYAILLTNDSLYWTEPSNYETNDENFRLHEGREIKGTLSWGDRTSKGLKKKERSLYP